MFQIDVDNVKGGLIVNLYFFVDFGDEFEGFVFVYEMWYFGGDCMLDIWFQID